MGVERIIEDRRMGALVGAIVGDLIGIPHEFSHSSAIPAGRLMPTGGGPFDFPPGVGSDDTDLLLAIVESYDTRRNFDPNVALDNMVAWYKTIPRDVGNTTAASLSYWEDDIPPPPNPDAQGNGGLMRAAAHGIMAKTLHAARVNAADDTRLTHNSRLAAELSAHMALVTWRLINCPSSDLDRVMSVRGPFLEEHKRMMRPYTGPVEDASGHCVHTLRLAKFALESAKSYEHGIHMVVGTGGDTDTNAAVAGALLGARFGEQAIPKDWRAAIAPELRDRIELIRKRFGQDNDADERGSRLAYA